jgi:hypothetical protein
MNLAEFMGFCLRVPESLPLEMEVHDLNLGDSERFDLFPV